ncbi:unnamed protein product [Allacma fusca]|uniref:Uncharacterized protein n=1 Tax=Allacma fusca TaxID=39272 RepID=A0A8J2JFX4_9HEXA|nr:unnamed protein product [Allacma fusca]
MIKVPVRGDLKVLLKPPPRHSSTAKWSPPQRTLNHSICGSCGEAPYRRFVYINVQSRGKFFNKRNNP